VKVVKKGFVLTAMVMAISLTATGCGSGAETRSHQNITTDMFAAALEQSGEKEAEDKYLDDTNQEEINDWSAEYEANQEETNDWSAEYEANQELYDQEYLDWLMQDDAESEGYIDDPLVAGHGAKKEDVENKPDLSTTEGVDIDLTLLSSTLVYAEVYNMMYYPEDYVGKIIKMKGSFNVYTDTEKGIDYLAVLVADATACCQQGLEFTWEGHKYPEDYPKMGTEMTVTGEVELYEEDGFMYLRIIADSVEF
jgi:hypothetical protein